MKPKPMGNCAVCGKRCQPWERNADGTYLHTNCAIGQAVWPERKTQKEES